jgi:SAM-dependent MidA family methyltransferase
MRHFTLPAHLPALSPTELDHSVTLLQLIAQRIHDQGDWLAFTDYMQMALYAPDYGYYTRQRPPIGDAASGQSHTGDFVTAPEISPLFGQTLAQPIGEWLRNCATSHIVEYGPGRGTLAAQLMLSLAQQGRAPDRYTLIEISPRLREIQAQTLQAQLPPELGSRIEWRDELPHDFTGIVLGNEVLDAFPTTLLTWHQSALWQVGLSVANATELNTALPELSYTLRPATESQTQVWTATHQHLPWRFPDDYPEGYVIELPIAQTEWLKEIGQRHVSGYQLWIDYGFASHEYYHPLRAQGTLIGHYRHHTLSDPLLIPGAQDLTVHVNFDQIQRTLAAHEWTCLHYSNQAQFLLAHGLLDRIHNASASQLHGVQTLLSEAEMGELIKVMVLQR